MNALDTTNVAATIVLWWYGYEWAAVTVATALLIVSVLYDYFGKEQQK